MNQPPNLNEHATKVNSIMVGLFGRAYTRPLGSRFVLYGQLDLYYESGKGETRTETVGPNGFSNINKSYDETNGRGMRLAGGAGYFFTDWLQLEATFGAFGFSSETTKSFSNDNKLASTTKRTQLDASLNLSSLWLGITFFLGKGKTPAPVDGK